MLPISAHFFARKPHKRSRKVVKRWKYDHLFGDLGDFREIDAFRYFVGEYFISPENTLINLFTSYASNWTAKSCLFSLIDFFSNFTTFTKKVFLATSMVQDSPMLCDQIKSLTASVNHLQRRLVKAEGRSLAKRVNALPPLPR